MKVPSSLALLALVAGIAGLGAGALQDKAPAKEKAAAAAPADDPEMMAKWMAFMTPGPEHKVLESRVGKWNGKLKMWMEPDAPAMESTCTSEFALLMGGRYLENKTNGSFMGMPFEGKGITGFDNLKKKYVSTWIDNMGTGVMSSEGTYDAAKQTFAYEGTGPDVMAGKYTPVKGVERAVDANSWVMEMHVTDPKSGKMFKTMEIAYTRAK